MNPAAEGEGPRLAMHGVVAGYGRSDVVLDGISLAIRPRQITVVLGANGSGKSTALRTIYGMTVIREGVVELDGKIINDLPPYRRLELGVALLPQGHSVFPDLSVEENLLVGGWIFGRDKAKLRQALERTYEVYPILAARRGDPAGSLSGGQQRLLEIARLIQTEPDILLIDEPSVGLAPVLVDEVYDEILRLRSLGKTLLVVDQNVETAIDLADYVYILEYGRNKTEGEVSDFEADVGAIVRDWLRV